MPALPCQTRADLVEALSKARANYVELAYRLASQVVDLGPKQHWAMRMDIEHARRIANTAADELASHEDQHLCKPSCGVRATA
jgi:hypothetical protein